MPKVIQFNYVKASNVNGYRQPAYHTATVRVIENHKVKNVIVYGDTWENLLDNIQLEFPQCNVEKLRQV